MAVQWAVVGQITKSIEIISPCVQIVGENSGRFSTFTEIHSLEEKTHSLGKKTHSLGEKFTVWGEN